MKKRWIKSLICVIMLSSVLLFSACGPDIKTTPTENSNPDLQAAIELGDKGKSFTYTYFDEDGRELKSSAFKEAYVFVDPGSAGTYYDKRTDSSVSFKDLVEREIDTLSEDISNRLLATYGIPTGNTIDISQQIIVGEGADIDVLLSNYKISYDINDSLGGEIKEDTSFTDEVINEFAPARYYMNDAYMLSLLMGLNYVSDAGVSTNNVSDFNVLKQYFVLDQATTEDDSTQSVVVARGEGFDTTIDKELNIVPATTTADTAHQWKIFERITNDFSILSLTREISEIILSVKSGDTDNYENIDHLGFTDSEIALIKDRIISDIIGDANYSYDTSCYLAIIANSSLDSLQKGGYVTINSEDAENKRVNGSEAFETSYAQLKALLSSKGPEGAEYIDAYNLFMASTDVTNYLKMFDYKGYEIVLNAIVESALKSPLYNGENLVPSEGECAESLYPLFPRIQVLIVPGMYLGGEYDESMEEDLEEEKEDEYDFEDIAEKSDFAPDYEPKTTMEPYLPSWKILSIVYKHDGVYGINNVTNERIEGVIVPDLDIAFVGQVGYTSIIESTVTYVVKGSEVVPAGEKFVSAELVDDVCPDMTASDYPDSHYLSIFDITKLEKEELNNYVLKAYNGVDLKALASSNDNIKIGKISTTGGKVYYEQVDGLPVDENFLTLKETTSGTVISMPGLGDNYLKLDVNFNKITDTNGNDVTAAQKRTQLGVISIEPHTAS